MSESILVTRPEPFGQALQKKIQSQGSSAIYFPTISIQTRTLSAKQLQKVHSQDWLIFTSPQAVIHGLQKIKPLLSDKIKIATIGAGTARELSKAQMKIDFIPSQWSSECLLKSETFQAVNNLKIMLIKGKEGRVLLKKEFTVRGAIVEELAVYKRYLPAVNISKSIYDLEKVRIIIITSVQSLLNLEKLFEKKVSLYDVPLLVVSDRIFKMAKKSGFKKIFLSPDASDESILKSLKNEEFL